MPTATTIEMRRGLAPQDVARTVSLRGLSTRQIHRTEPESRSVEKVFDLQLPRPAALSLFVSSTALQSNLKELVVGKEFVRTSTTQTDSLRYPML
jgi:hypothetical protein